MTILSCINLATFFGHRKSTTVLLIFLFNLEEGREKVKSKSINYCKLINVDIYFLNIIYIKILNIIHKM